MWRCKVVLCPSEPKCFISAICLYKYIFFEDMMSSYFFTWNVWGRNHALGFNLLLAGVFIKNDFFAFALWLGSVS